MKSGYATIEYVCPQCGAVATEHISELGYRYSAGHGCSAKCGYAMEEDGRQLEGPRREAVLEQSGTWELWISLTAATRLNAMRVFREILHWPVSRVSSETRVSPVMVWKGTAGEVSWFGSEFDKAGVTTEIRRVS
jgi:hypothetical protein